MKIVPLHFVITNQGDNRKNVYELQFFGGQSKGSNRLAVSYVNDSKYLSKTMKFTMTKTNCTVSVNCRGKNLPKEWILTEFNAYHAKNFITTMIKKHGLTPGSGNGIIGTIDVMLNIDDSVSVDVEPIKEQLVLKKSTQTNQVVKEQQIIKEEECVMNTQYNNAAIDFDVVTRVIKSDYFNCLDKEDQLTYMNVYAKYIRGFNPTGGNSSSTNNVNNSVNCNDCKDVKQLTDRLESAKEHFKKLNEENSKLKERVDAISAQCNLYTSHIASLEANNKKSYELLSNIRGILCSESSRLEMINGIADVVGVELQPELENSDDVTTSVEDSIEQEDVKHPIVNEESSHTEDNTENIVNLNFNSVSVEDIELEDIKGDNVVSDDSPMNAFFVFVGNVAIIAENVDGDLNPVSDNLLDYLTLIEKEEDDELSLSELLSDNELVTKVCNEMISRCKLVANTGHLDAFKSAFIEDRDAVLLEMEDLHISTEIEAQTLINNIDVIKHIASNDVINNEDVIKAIYSIVK